MTYTLIGTGNMAKYLANHLSDAGIRCVGLYGRNQEKAKELSSFLKTKFVENISELPISDVCLIAVSDQAIEPISKLLPKEQTTAFHFAGSATITQIIQQNKGVIWPIYSISPALNDKQIPVVIECNNEQATLIAHQIAASLTNKIIQVRALERQWLHLCAVLMNNFGNHLAAISKQICAENGLPFQLFLPILQQTVEKINNGEDPKHIQTGPARRNDILTLERHLSLLSEQPTWRDLYLSCTRSILEMYKDGQG
ncbi:MAG: DUF2520 domain-containing protein [Bacteroidetes bacterium]|nr:DUF2520 domain-containing protein [Bacteroidota bacterium]MBS1739133.1 DUF2520 domain-containing protein [Bacteroidota bacterium]MBS1740602.1 DUF2520 domain-containing protein [Bacteroidota bacterium]MBS1777172.1 DUF2520 domain-containing protein [Bacteroidota bacterium]